MPFYRSSLQLEEFADSSEPDQAPCCKKVREVERTHSKAGIFFVYNKKKLTFSLHRNIKGVFTL